MTLVAWLGWCCAAGSALVALLAVARLRAHGATVARAAHELRGGLGVIQLALESTGEPRLETIDLQLHRAARALAELDGAVADVAGVVDFAAIVRAVCRAWPSVDVQIGRTPLLVRGDRAELAQACSNLVANAVEHGGHPVRVRAEVRDGTAGMEVADSGPGLPAAPELLAARARGSLSRRGHGLAVAVDVARRHGGRIGSRPAARGARVVLELPASDQS